MAQLGSLTTCRYTTRLGPPPHPSASVHRPADAYRRICVFHGIWVFGGGGGVPRGLGHNLLMQLSSLGSSKNGRPSPLFEVSC